jgi:hypothetical protein
VIRGLPAVSSEPRGPVADAVKRRVPILIDGRAEAWGTRLRATASLGKPGVKQAATPGKGPRPNTPIFQQIRASTPAATVYHSEILTRMSQILGTRNCPGLTVSPAPVGIVTA